MEEQHSLGSQADAGPSWERQAGESPAAYGAFQVYLELGPNRTLQATAEQFGRSVSLLKRWSAHRHWRARAAAWEAHQRQQAEAVAVDAQEETYQRRQRHAEQLERVAMAGLRSLLVRDHETGETRFDTRLRPTEIASLIRVACHLLPTPPIALDPTVAESSALESLSEADLAELEAMLKNRLKGDAHDTTL